MFPTSYLFGCAILVPFALPWSARFALLQVLAMGAGLLALGFAVARFVPLSIPVLPAAGTSVWLVIGLGLVLRIAWIALVPPVQLSDMREYVAAARQLLAGEGYFNLLGSSKLFAFRPPGESFLLAAAFSVFGDHAWTPALVNLLCYVGAAWLLHQIVTGLGGTAAALLADMLFAIWPSHIMSTGLALSELPTLLLWLTVLWCMLHADPSQPATHEWRWMVLAGLSIGVGIIIRPTLLLTPLMLGAIALCRREARWPALKQVVLMSVLAALVVAPWTIRNYMKFSTLVVVSTNGGDVLYRANNPLATGGFAPFGEKSFSNLLPDEVRWNDVSAAAAHEWILHNPVAFVRLSFRKLAITLGEDDTGAYLSMVRPHGSNGTTYYIARWISNAWWYAVWVLATLALWRQRAWLASTTAGLAVPWFIFYFMFLHSVFESQPRYHMPSVGPLLILAALAFRASAGAQILLAERLKA